MSLERLQKLATEAAGIDGNGHPTQPGMSIRIEDDPWFNLLQDGRDIAAEQLPPVVEIVSGVLAEGCKLVIASGSKSFKTWLTMMIGLCIAHGLPVWDRDTKRKIVLYANLELRPIAFKRRVQDIAEALNLAVDAKTLFHLPLRGKIAGLDVHEIISRIIRFAQHCKAEVVVLDPLYKLNRGDENSSRDQTVLFNEIDRLTTEAGCAVVLNDHFGKGNQSDRDPLDAIRGSSAKAGDVDAAIVLRKHDVQDCFRVDVVQRELPPVEPFVIGWKKPLMELRPDLDPGKMKKVKGGRTKKHDPLELLDIIRETTKKKPISISAWSTKAGTKRTTLLNYVEILRGKEWIATVGEGASSRQYITALGREALTKHQGRSE